MKKKKILVAFVVILSLGGLLVFLGYAEKIQSQRRNQLMETSIQQEMESMNMNMKLEAQNSICIYEVADSDASYIELYNPTKIEVNMGGYEVNVNGSSKESYSFQEDFVIGAGEKLPIYLGKAALEGAVCSDMALKYDGSDIIRLYNAEKQLIDSLLIPKLSKGEAYTCTELGISYRIISLAAAKDGLPGMANLKEGLSFSVPSGFYDDEFDLEIYSESGVSIYYTLDGSTPTTDSELYTGAIHIKDVSASPNNLCMNSDTSILKIAKPTDLIDKAVIIRAIAVNDRKMIKGSISGVYFVDYERRVSYHNMPVLSIITDPENLFGYWDGIYVKGVGYDNALIVDEPLKAASNYCKDIKKECSQQFFDSNHTLTNYGESKLSIYQDGCVNDAQKSLYLSGMPQYSNGSEIGQYQVNTDDGWSLLLSSGQIDYQSKVRNQLIQNRIKTLGLIPQNVMKCIVFLNGEYWGVYNVCEQLTKKNVSQTYGVNEDNIISFYHYKFEDHRSEDFVLYNDLKTWFQEADLSTDEMYAQACEKIDVESFASCYSCHLYTANSEWSEKELYMWRSRTTSNKKYEDGKWRFSIPNMNSCAGIDAKSNYSIDTFLKPSVSEDIFFQALIKNKQFQKLLKDKLLLMAADTFESESVKNLLAGYYEEYRDIMIQFSQRYNGLKTSDQFDNQIRIAGEFFEKRSEYILRYLDEYLASCLVVKEEEQ